MTKETIHNTLRYLEKLMYGYNYEVTIGVDIFENCSTLEEFQKVLNEKYNTVKAELYEPILLEQVDFWEEVDFGLTYRGDEASGLKLTEKKEGELLVEQAKLKNFLKQFISDTTKIYSYPEELGMPGYIVYWGYTFLLLNEDKASILIYGSASD